MAQTDIFTSNSQIPILINNRDRLACLLQLIGWLERAGQSNIHIIDNDSSYPPLLDYYRHCPHRVIKLGGNFGHLAPWTQGIVQDLAQDQYYVVTDPDIVPVEYCPADALARFQEILARYPDRSKVGFGLKIDDLPTHYKFAEAVKAWEGRFWEQSLEPGLYDATIDTSFALYRPNSPHNLNGLRTGEPYVARHTPWYVDTRHPNVEDKYYRDHLDPGINHWDGAELPDRLEEMMKSAGISVPRPQGLQFASLFQRFARHKSYKALPVAIIIPTFKRAANLRRVIENVEAVTTGDYVIYFVIESDDTSTAGELAKISDPSVKVIVNSGPKTYPGAINTAFCNTQEPLFFCGADDVRFYPEWLPNAVRRHGERCLRSRNQ